MIKRFLVLSILLLTCTHSWAQLSGQNFNSYVGGLPPATTPYKSTDSLYMLQGGQSRQTPAINLNQLTAFPVDRYGAKGDGITDDVIAFRGASFDCQAAGGGYIVLGPKRYLIDSLNLTVGVGCAIYCPIPAQVTRGPTGQTSFATLPYTIILNPASILDLKDSAGFMGCNLLQKNVASLTPTTIRDTLSMQTAFAGVGITLGQNSAVHGVDVTIRDAFIGGFACGIMPAGETCGSTTPAANPAHVARLFLSHVNIDANQCVWIDQAHDITTAVSVECFPFMTSASAANTGYTITGIADNGLGTHLWRVTTSAPTAIATKDTVWVDGNGTGAPSAIGRWTATVINSTTIDLQGSDANGVTPTGNVVSGQTMITGLSSLAGIGPGSNISGTGIPAATTVVAILTTGNAIVISAAATASNTGTTLTISDTAFSVGGKIWLDANFRSGPGFEFTNLEGSTCTGCFVFDHNIGFYVSTLGQWLTCVSCTIDHSFGPGWDRTVAGVLLDSSGTNARFIGLQNLSGVNLFVVNSSAGATSHVISNSYIDVVGSSGVMLELDKGSVILDGNIAPSTDKWVTMKDASNSLIMSGNNIQNSFSAQSSVSLARIVPAGNVNGHMAVPTISACGTGSPTATGTSTDYSGAVTEGTNATTCTVTFAQAFYDTPICTVTPHTPLTTFTYNQSKTAITITHDSNSGATLGYYCTAREGK